MRPPRSLAALTVLVALSGAVLTGCGGGSDNGDGSTDDRSQSAAAAGDGVETAATGDSGDTGGEDASATGFADCTAITAEEIAPVLGEGTGTSEVPPGGGSCTYKLNDPTQPSVSVEQFTTADFADGFEGAAANISATAVGPIEGSTETDVAGVGDAAKVAVGPSPLGGKALQSIGLVLVGDTIVRATVLQAVDLDADEMLELTTGILELIASKA